MRDHQTESTVLTKLSSDSGYLSVGSKQARYEMRKNAKLPLVSVIMPVHNSENYLVKSASSVLDQSLQDFELILIDNNSTDSSGIIITQLVGKDSRVVSLCCAEP